MAVQSSMQKWKAAAQDEIILSQKSSEEILEADAMKEDSASRVPSEQDEREQEKENRAAQLGNQANGIVIDVECTFPREDSWWVKELKMATGTQNVNLARKKPLLLLSACSGMLSEAKVLEAGSARV